LQHTAGHCNTLQHTYTSLPMPLFVPVITYKTLQHAATRRNTLHHAATHCNTLQHAATHLYLFAYASICACNDAHLFIPKSG